MELIHIRGRGAASNPAGRFERLAFEPDADWSDPDDPAPWKHTQYFRDHSRTILSRNDSPDVGFTVSVNPYRGCSHGCSYCLSGETRILMGDGTTQRLDAIHEGDEIYGTVLRGSYRRYVRTRVLAHWSTMEPAFRVVLEDGTTLVASGDHRFLTRRGWKHVVGRQQGRQRRPHLTVNDKLMGVGGFARPPEMDAEYRLGYLCGIIRGDALLASYHYERVGCAHGDQHQFRLALVDDTALRRTADFLGERGIRVHWFMFSVGSQARTWMRAIRTHRRDDVERIRGLIAWPAVPTEPWSRGFLAGIFDAEGSYSTGVLRISNTSLEILARASACLARLGFECRLEHQPGERAKPIHTLRLLGGLKQHLRFFHTVSPAIRRRCDIEGQAVKSGAALRVVDVEPLNRKFRLYDITTGTGDFIAEGVISHNCYARPTHEWLGLSAGLDFVSRVFVKEVAPVLLRRALASPRWNPAPIAFSGVTDAYQPVERRLELTRRCLRVLAEFRNPVCIVTKSQLVARDADVLGEMAGWGGAVVYLSITSLDQELQKKLEPRAASPARRLAALETLARAGVPVGVLVAPVIPGLTDHELPAILAAAAGAGARTAGFVPLRLPYGLKELFDEWLSIHAPERRAKVLHRVREIRGGVLNDSRFGARMRGEGPYADQLRALFHVTCRKLGLNAERTTLDTTAFRPPDPTGQLDLLEG
jgi:DNA repair photolyase